MKKLVFPLFLTLVSVGVFAQCENVKGNNESMNDWQNLFIDYFNVDSNYSFIKADSILIFYFSNSENETNYGMPCCYYLAEQYAQTELAEHLKILYSKLEKEDSVNFLIAQKSWQTYYENEWEFVRNSFIAYSNLSKYGLGRETMIENQARRYHIIKNRIQTIQGYIETVFGRE